MTLILRGRANTVQRKRETYFKLTKVNYPFFWQLLEENHSSFPSLPDQNGYKRLQTRFQDLCLGFWAKARQVLGLRLHVSSVYDVRFRSKPSSQAATTLDAERRSSALVLAVFPSNNVLSQVCAPTRVRTLECEEQTSRQKIGTRVRPWKRGKRDSTSLEPRSHSGCGISGYEITILLAEKRDLANQSER